MKNSGSQGQAKGSGTAYGQPYIQGATNDSGSSAHRVGANSNLKSYINELKKVSNANKTGGKRGHSSTRQGAAAATSSNIMRQSQQAVVQTYGNMSGMPQTTKSGMGQSANQFQFEQYQGVANAQGASKSRQGAVQQQLSELALKDNVTGVGSGKNGNSNLTQLVSPSQTFARTGSRQGSTYNRALSNGQMPQTSQSQPYQLLSPQNQGMPHQGNPNQFAPIAAAAQSTNNRSGQPQQQFLAGFMSPQANQQMMNQTQQAFASSASKINSNNASSKAFQYLQKKGNLHSNQHNNGGVGSHAQGLVSSSEMPGAERSNSHLIKRIGSGRQQHFGNQTQEKPGTRKSNTRGGTRNQSQNYNNSASQALLNAQQNFSGGQQTNQNLSQQKHVKHVSSDGRVQKDVIIRKNSSKSLLPHGASNGQNPNATNMPNISNVKQQSDGVGSKTRGASQGQPKVVSGVLLLNTESMDRETANTSKVGGTNSNHKRVTSNPNNYVKVQNSEIQSTGTADAHFQGGLPSTNNYTTAGQNSRGGIPHTLGNSLGGNPNKQSLNMSNYGGYFSAIQRDSSLNENNTLAKTGINLSSLIRQNLLEEDGIEDLHFYFVSFQQHKKQILAHQKKRQEIRLKEKAGHPPTGKSAPGNGAPRMVVPKIPINGVNGQQQDGRGLKLNFAASSSGSRNKLGSTTSPNSKGESETAHNKTIESCDDEEFF